MKDNKLRHEAWRRGATSIGWGRKRPGEEERIIFGVPKKIKPIHWSKDLNLITSEYSGVVQTGNIKALGNTDKLRPARPGCSIGHVDITAGTFGLVVKRNGVRMILSNNHILANSNDAEIGSIILQPGPHDGGTLNDQIGTLHHFIPIRFMNEESTCRFSRGAVHAGNFIYKNLALNKPKTRFPMPVAHTTIQDAIFNTVDCALCMPFNPQDISDEIIGIGAPVGEVRGKLGMEVQKSGRTTGYTFDKIIQTDVTVQVQYDAGKIAVFQDQLMAGAMSLGGDSGSAVLDINNRVTGLLFAGSDSTTIINRWEYVADALNINIGE